MKMSRAGKRSKSPTVLIGVLKDRRDLRILLKRGWYRIPAARCPKRGFDYLAFYQPSAFGRAGKRIRYYARVIDRDMVKRRELLPEERRHPRAGDDHFRFRVGAVKELSRPIRNRGPRRVTFGFTTLGSLLRARDLLQLFDVPPLERIVAGGLKRARIAAIPEYPVSAKGGRRRTGSRRMTGSRRRTGSRRMTGSRRYRLDFAVPCRNGKIDVECDGEKWHSAPAQKRRDADRDRRLAREGWTVVRLKERRILEDLKGCVARVKRGVARLGGL